MLAKWWLWGKDQFQFIAMPKNRKYASEKSAFKLNVGNMRWLWSLWSNEKPMLFPPDNIHTQFLNNRRIQSHRQPHRQTQKWFVFDYYRFLFFGWVRDCMAVCLWHMQSAAFNLFKPMVYFAIQCIRQAPANKCIHTRARARRRQIEW